MAKPPGSLLHINQNCLPYILFLLLKNIQAASDDGGGKKQCRPAEACHDPRPSPDFRMCEFAKCINFAFEVPHPVITSASHHTQPYHLSSTPLNIPSISYPAPVHRSSLFPILPMLHYPICLLCCPSHSPIHLPPHLLPSIPSISKGKH